MHRAAPGRGPTRGSPTREQTTWRHGPRSSWAPSERRAESTDEPARDCVETLEGGWNVLRPDLDGLSGLVARNMTGAARSTPYGDGTAAMRVADVLDARA